MRDEYTGSLTFYRGRLGALPQAEDSQINNRV